MSYSCSSTIQYTLHFLGFLPSTFPFRDLIQDRKHRLSTSFLFRLWNCSPSLSSFPDLDISEELRTPFPKCFSLPGLPLLLEPRVGGGCVEAGVVRLMWGKGHLVEAELASGTDMPLGILGFSHPRKERPLVVRISLRLAPCFPRQSGSV